MTRNAKTLGLFALIVLGLAATTLSAKEFGRFVGDLIVKFAPDGRNVVLEQPFAFIDSNGKEWSVPIGTETDGASVPAAFWALYPPFTGTYRSAAVIHDRYCQTKERSWQDTHAVFYDAMRAANVDERTAKVLYGAVYYFGPRWGPDVPVEQRRAAHRASPEEQAEFLKNLQTWVDEENPDLEAVTRVDRKGRPLSRQTNRD